MVNFHMEKLTVSIKDKKDKNEIIRLTVGELQSTLAQRPGAQAIKSVVKLAFFPFCLCDDKGGLNFSTSGSA